MNPQEKPPLLQVEELRVAFHTPAGVVKAVNGVSYTLERGEVMGVVGESGSGKSMEAYAILGLIPSPGKVTGGAIRVGLLEKRRPVLTVDNSCQHVNALPLPRLFDRFYRGDSARTYGSGFGVGLSIAKGIAQRQGGDITALGLEGDKIRFRVKL